MAQNQVLMHQKLLKKILSKIIKENNITNFYDLIIYRGTIQYLDDPFISIQKSYDSLKKNGHIFFFAPNTRSIYYFLFKTLPFLENPYMKWIPSDET